MTDISRVRSFAPVIDAGARILILGSMPGVKSLREQQYYAHPRNLFWTFIAEIFERRLPSSYRERLALLCSLKLALWDVAEECERPGSLDSNIREVRANDIASLIKDSASIQRIVFNGASAASLFHRHQYRDNKAIFDRVELIQLPSTSPANASIPRAEKLRRWTQALLI